jgi:hypothetical protein
MRATSATLTGARKESWKLWIMRTLGYRSISERPFSVFKRALSLYIAMVVAAVLMVACITIPFSDHKQEVKIRVYPHVISADGGIKYHALCEIYERKRGREIRSASFNNAAIQINGYDLHLDEGFMETHRGEQYEDYIINGRFLYNGDELILDSIDEVRIRMVHPKFGRVERTIQVPISVRKVHVDKEQRDLWLAGDVSSLSLEWSGTNADRYQILFLAMLQDGHTERTYLDTPLQEASIERAELKLTPGFDFTAHNLEIEIVASNTLEFDVERIRFNWTVDSPFAYRFRLN